MSQNVIPPRAATSIAPGTAIGNVTPGTAAFTTLSSSSTTALSTELAAKTTIGSGATTTKLNVSGAHVANIGVAQFTGVAADGYIAIGSALGGGSAGIVLSPAGVTTVDILGSTTGVRIRNRLFGTTDQFTINNVGSVGIGTIGASATAHLHLAAGNASAGRAPLKLTSGVLNTLPEPGGEEFLADDRYYTGSDGVRRRYAVNTNVINLKGFTVAGLPTGVQGDKAYVTDALAPVYLAAVAGGGAVVTEVFRNATTWVCT